MMTLTIRKIANYWQRTRKTKSRYMWIFRSKMGRSADILQHQMIIQELTCKTRN